MRISGFFLLMSLLIIMTGCEQDPSPSITYADATPEVMSQIDGTLAFLDELLDYMLDYELYTADPGYDPVTGAFSYDEDETAIAGTILYENTADYISQTGDLVVTCSGAVRREDVLHGSFDYVYDFFISEDEDGDSNLSYGFSGEIEQTSNPQAVVEFSFSYEIQGQGDFDGSDVDEETSGWVRVDGTYYRASDFFPSLQYKL